ncbi:hypothetical protein [Microlunatus sp. Gsoil 973]|uniref:hypothetical protein n=1 Tax=Microlunatus sp. Gsoil 973 TaxID=2672569 RepID=UPI0012B4F7D3|nr:hypothetical protein [Microlunatus sp. Gsoil 973]QGN32800.1 hypothetical protein GJV80_08245 [Microlunatus sp. Gsoil 973]
MSIPRTPDPNVTAKATIPQIENRLCRWEMNGNWVMIEIRSPTAANPARSTPDDHSSQKTIDAENSRAMATATTGLIAT